MKNRLALLASAMLILGLLVGLTSSASARVGGQLAVAKKKKCRKGTHRGVVKRKDGTKKRKCVPNKGGGDDTTEPDGSDDPIVTVARLTVNPTGFIFPDTEAGKQSAAVAFSITNTGGSASTLPSVSITELSSPTPGGHPGFAIAANTCLAPVAPGAVCVVSVRFQPTSAEPQRYGSVLEVAAALGGKAQVGLVGTGVPPAKLAIAPAVFDYPDTQQGSQSPPQTFTVTNTGGVTSGPLATSITDVTDPVQGDDPAFVFGADNCTGVDLPAGGSCNVDGIFAPPTGGGGDYHSRLEVTGSPGISVQADLTGHAD